MEKRNEQENCDNTEKFWGYLVCSGVVITFIAGIGHVNSFGLLYNDFIIETNASARSLTAAHGVFAAMLAVGGISLNILSKKQSLRSSGFIGSILFITGAFSTIFIPNISSLIVTFGILQGIGFGMMVPVCYGTLNHYFIKKRTTVMSICKAIQGIILMGYPQLLKLLMSAYGLKGTLLILSGISTHTFLGIMTMHQKERKTKKRSANEKCVNENVDLLELNRENYMEITKSNNQIVNFRNKVFELLNLKLLKDPVFCNICLGMSFVNFSDLSYFMLQPMLLFQYGYTKSQVASDISICAGADVLGRIGLAVISAVISIDTRYLFYIATFATFFARIMLLQLETFAWVAFWSGILGFLRAWLHVASPLVVASHVTNEDFPGAYAFLTLTTGLVNVGVSPVIGLLKDVYEDYVPAFYALSLCCLPCLLGWSLELILKK